MIEYLFQLDRDLFLFLNGLNASWLDPIMFFISDKFAWIPLYMFLLWLCIRYYGWKTILIVVLIVVLITLSDQITGFMKSYFKRPRPSRDDSLEGLVHIVNGYRGGRFGFVSSHAANSFALAGFIIYLFSRKLNYIFYLMLSYAILNSYSRIYLGVHYPMDILGGMITGLIISALVVRLWTYAEPKLYPVKRDRVE